MWHANFCRLGRTDTSGVAYRGVYYRRAPAGGRAACDRGKGACNTVPSIAGTGTGWIACASPSAVPGCASDRRACPEHDVACLALTLTGPVTANAVHAIHGSAFRSSTARAARRDLSARTAYTRQALAIGVCEACCRASQSVRFALERSTWDFGRRFACALTIAGGSRDRPLRGGVASAAATSLAAGVKLTGTVSVA